MEIRSVWDDAFRPYGRVLEGYDFAPLCRAMESVPCPEDGTVYAASSPALEALECFAALRDRGFGGLDTQLGYCNGVNFALDCLEYHLSSELDVACTDLILLLGLRTELEEGFRLHTDRVRAFLVPAGVGVELYATTLHYAPCGAAPGAAFRMACALPRGTNTCPPDRPGDDPESRLLRARNKWLIAAPGTPEAREGAHVGLCGPGIELFS